MNRAAARNENRYNDLRRPEDCCAPEYRLRVEHLGLLDDEAYARRWDRKAAEYEALGLGVETTTEADVADPVETVNRLVERAESRLDENTRRLVRRTRELRRTTGLSLTPPELRGNVVIARTAGPNADGVVAVLASLDGDQLEDEPVSGLVGSSVVRRSLRTTSSSSAEPRPRRKVPQVLAQIRRVGTGLRASGSAVVVRGVLRVNGGELVQDPPDLRVDLVNEVELRWQSRPERATRDY